MRPPVAYLLLLLIFGSLVHLALRLPELATHPDVLNFDAYEYFDAGRMLYREEATPHPTRMLGFAAFTGWISLFSERSEPYFRLVYAFNGLCWLGTGVLLWSLGRSIRPKAPRLAAVPALLFGLNVGGIVLISQPLTETFYGFLLVLAAWCGFRAQRSGADRWILTAWTAVLLATWLRPTAFIWVIIMGLFLLRNYWLSKNTLQKKLRQTGLMLAVPVLTLGWQVAAMQAHYGQWKLTNIGLLTYYFYTDAYATVWRSGDSWASRAEAWGVERDRRKRALGLEPDHRRGILRLPDWPALTDSLEDRIAGTWRRRPGTVACTLGRNLVSNSLAGSMNAEFLAGRAPEPNLRLRARAVFWLSRLQNLFCTGLALLTAVAAARRWSDREARYFGLLSAFALTVYAGSAISFAQGDRFHVAVAPLGLLGLLYLFRSNRSTDVQP